MAFCHGSVNIHNQWRESGSRVENGKNTLHTHIHNKEAEPMHVSVRDLNSNQYFYA